MKIDWKLVLADGFTVGFFAALVFAIWQLIHYIFTKIFPIL